MELIAAVDENFAIGYKNNLLARISTDLKRFKSFTTGNIIICGKNTYLSFPKRPLPDRENIVITHDADAFPEAICFDSIEKCIEYCKNSDKTCYVCGGGMIYKDMLPYCTTAHITKIHKSFQEADTYMPNLDRLPEWEITEVSDIMNDGELKFQYVTYSRKKA